MPLFWTAALLGMYLMDPGGQGGSLCLFRFLGLESCPGCGLGHAVHYALHLDFSSSWQAHWLGVPVTLAILTVILKPFISPENKFKHDRSATTTYDAARHSA
jgi:hypothetical protein